MPDEAKWVEQFRCPCSGTTDVLALAGVEGIIRVGYCGGLGEALLGGNCS